MLSVILPAYNEEAMIPVAAKTIPDILDAAEIPYELLFVDDGSRDKTWEEIQAAARQNSHVVGVHFSRNFGKEAAMFAGLEQARGDCCAVMDCDLQHPPEKLVEMYRLWEQGFEVVEGIKEDRGEETGFHRFAANSFYGIISRATGMDMSSSSDFKLLDRKVVDALNQMPERNVFFRALSFWVGFRRTTVSYRVQERTAGESKWSTRSLIKYAISNIGSFSSAPLHIITVLVLVLLVPPPRSLGSPPGNDRRDLLPNILQGRIQLLRGHAHHLLTQKLISMGNSAANHVIGVRGASRLVPLPLLCNDLLLVWRPRNISRKKWQNLRVRHKRVPSYIALCHTPWLLSCLLTPIIRLKRARAEVREGLHNLSRCQRWNIRRRSRYGLDVSVLPQYPLRQVTVHPTVAAHDPTRIPKYLLERLELPVPFVRPPAYVIKRNAIKQ